MESYFQGSRLASTGMLHYSINCSIHLCNSSHHSTEFVKHDVEMVLVESKSRSEPDSSLPTNPNMNPLSPHTTHNLVPPLCRVTINCYKSTPPSGVLDHTRILHTQ